MNFINEKAYLNVGNKESDAQESKMHDIFDSSGWYKISEAKKL